MALLVRMYLEPISLQFIDAIPSLESLMIGLFSMIHHSSDYCLVHFRIFALLTYI